MRRIVPGTRAPSLQDVIVLHDERRPLKIRSTIARDSLLAPSGLDEGPAHARARYAHGPRDRQRRSVFPVVTRGVVVARGRHRQGRQPQHRAGRRRARHRAARRPDSRIPTRSCCRRSKKLRVRRARSPARAIRRAVQAWSPRAGHRLYLPMDPLVDDDRCRQGEPAGAHRCARRAAWIRASCR